MIQNSKIQLIVFHKQKMGCSHSQMQQEKPIHKDKNPSKEDNISQLKNTDSGRFIHSIPQCSIDDIEKYLNDVRANPSKYAKKIQQQLSLFLDEYTLPLKDGLNYRTNEGQSAWKETIQFLKQQQPLPPMEAHSGLSLAAKAHANDLAHLDDISHTGTDGSTPFDRIKRYCVDKDGKSGQNIGTDFQMDGRNYAQNIIIHLVIDDGVQSRGHRLSIFDKDFKYFGAYSVRQGEKIVTVITYLSKYWANRKK